MGRYCFNFSGVLPGARQIEEPPMAWYTSHKDYISPHILIFYLIFP